MQLDGAAPAARCQGAPQHKVPYTRAPCMHHADHAPSMQVFPHAVHSAQQAVQQARAASGTPLDVAAWARRYAIENVSRMLYGEVDGQGGVDEYLATVEGVLKVMQLALGGAQGCEAPCRAACMAGGVRCRSSCERAACSAHAHASCRLRSPGPAAHDKQAHVCTHT